MKNTKRPFDRLFNELPNKVQIFEQIEKSKCDAIRDAIEIGLLEKDSVERISFDCQVAPVSIKAKKITVVSEGNVSISSTLLRREAIVLKNYAEKFTEKEVPETSSYVEVFRCNERRIIIKKMSFCWLLRKDCLKLSSDRLLRVRSDTQPVSRVKVSRQKTKRTNLLPRMNFKINVKKNKKKHFSR